MIDSSILHGHNKNKKTTITTKTKKSSQNIKQKLNKNEKNNEPALRYNRIIYDYIQIRPQRIKIGICEDLTELSLFGVRILATGVLICFYHADRPLHLTRSDDNKSVST